MSVLWSRTRERLAVDLIRWLPKSTYGKAVGFLARRHVPRRLREPLFTRFARRYGADLGLVERPLDAYASFGEFFARRLREGMRPIDADPDVAVSPVDGRIVESGTITAGRLLQAKGIDYTLRALLIDEPSVSQFDGGTYVTFYLAPGDYHRIHTPAGGTVLGYRHIPGAFFPVGPASVRHIAGLFARNERLVSYLDGPLGPVAVVKVAATGVGNITVAYDETVCTRRRRRVGRVHYKEPRPIAKGAELGTFHLGSTVIVLFARGRVALEPLAVGARVLMGQAIGRRIATAAGDAAA